MGKRENGSSYKKASIAMAVALIVIGALWCAISFASAGDTIRTISVDTKAKNSNELVSFDNKGSTVIYTEILEITAQKIDITMLSAQNAIVRFKVNKNFAHALALNAHGDIVETHEFINGRTDIDFNGTKTNTVIILASEDDKYGSNQDREDFLDWCTRQTRGRDKSRTIDFLIDESARASSSNDFVGIVVVKTKVVQPEIANISWKWDDDELEITGTSNLPRCTEIEWKIFEKFWTTEARRNGKIGFTIDAGDVGVIGDCSLEIWVKGAHEEFQLNISPPPELEQGISIKPKASPEPAPRPTPKPTLKPTATPKPTPKITRVLADPPAKIADDVEKAREELAKKSKLTKILETEIKWLPEIMTFVIAIVALLILRKKMKK